MSEATPARIEDVEAVFAHVLLNAAPVAAIVDDRVSFLVRPQDEHDPTIVVSRGSTLYARTFGGRSAHEKGRIRLTCFAPDYRTLKRLTRAASDAVDEFEGIVGGIEVTEAQVEDVFDLPDLSIIDRDERLLAAAVELQFTFERTD